MMSYLRQSIRSVTSRPAFAGPAILSLSLGMAATIMFFSLVDRLLFRPVPGVRAADEIALVTFVSDRSLLDAKALRLGISPASFEVLSEHVRAGSALAAVSPAELNLGADDENLAERVSGAIVSGSYFGTLGVKPGIGRLIGPADADAGAEPVAVISDFLWRRRFGAAGEAVGGALRVGGVIFTIVGVGPAGFRGEKLSAPVDVFLPMNEHGVAAAGRPRLDLTDPSSSMIDRLVARITTESMRDGLRTDIEGVLALSASGANGGSSLFPRAQIDVGLGLDEPLRTTVERQSFMISAFVLLILLATCGNATYLHLARSIAKRHEIAVRRALGAGSFRIFGQLAGESAILAGAAAVLGLLLALWTVDLLEGVRLMPDLPPVADVTFDSRIVVFAATLVVLTVAILGAVPGWVVSGVHPRESFRGAGGMPSRRDTRALQCVVAGQIAAAMCLGVTALLLSRSVHTLRAADLGFDQEGVHTMAVDLAPETYAPSGRSEAFWLELIERSAGIPGVTHAAYTSALPIGTGTRVARLWPENRQEPADGAPPIRGLHVTPEYFNVMGIRIIAGEPPPSGDTSGIAVDERLAGKLWPELDPVSVIGRRVQFDGSQSRAVVAVTVHIAHVDPDIESDPRWYVSAAGRHLRGFLVVRAPSLDADNVAMRVRGHIRDMDPDIAAFDVMTMADRVRHEIADSRILSTLLIAFGGFAVLLALLGQYGLQSYAVTIRTREMGLRQALGASRRTLGRAVVTEAMTVALVGISAGAMLAAGGGGLIRTKLYGVTAIDPVSYAVVGIAMLLFTCGVAALPALRAVRIVPADALRHD